MATREDATLLVQLMSWGTQMGVDDAMRTLFSEGFDSATAAPDDPAIRTVLTFGETIGTLTKHGVLDRELVLDLIWVQGIWGKVGPHALADRQRMGEPRLFENFEALAASAPG